MDTISLAALKAALIYTAQQIIDSEGRLTELDTIIGDGDHGIGMREGFSALKKLLSATEYPNAFELFKASGIELLRTMGGASGVIFGTLFTGGYGAVQGKTSLTADDLIAFFEQSAQAIMKRGRSAPGDKTMLDALVPAVQAMKQRRQTTASPKEILLAAAKGAEEGAKASEQMLPKTGRSKNFREQALGYPDPGAVSVSILFRSLYEGILLHNKEISNEWQWNV